MKHTHNRLPLWDSPEEVIQMYKQGMTLDEIGASLGVARATVGSIIRKAGISVSASDRRLLRFGSEVQRLYVEESRSLAETARALGVSIWMVKEVLRSLGIKQRTYTNAPTKYPELRQLKIGEFLDLPRVKTGTLQHTYVRYYVMAKYAGIKVSVRVISEDKVRVTRKA